MLVEINLLIILLLSIECVSIVVGMKMTLGMNVVLVGRMVLGIDVVG